MSHRKERLRTRIERLAEAAAAARHRLETRIRIGDRDLALYRAGQREGQAWFGLFGRDLLITALLLDEPGFSREAVRFVVGTLGERFDPVTGEEPGRGLHEFEDVTMRGLSTRYDACDVSALLLVLAARHRSRADDGAFLREVRSGLTAAVEYLLRHCHDGLAVEDPAVCGAERYALRATYWKDSHLPGREDPAYPVTYALVQAQTVAALHAAAGLAEDLPDLSASKDTLKDEADRATGRLRDDLWDPILGYPLIALDRDGPIRGISSDALHMLFYLPAGAIDDDRLAAIAHRAVSLETPYGYRSYASGQTDYDPHAYHLGAIWPFEQALIACGARAHGLAHVQHVALQVVEGLERLGFHELFYWSGDAASDLEGGASVDGQGCDLQLWTLAVPAALLSLVDGR